MVIAGQHEEALVEARRVFEFFVNMPRGDGRNGGVKGRGVAEAGVLVGRGKSAGHAAA